MLFLHQRENGENPVIGICVSSLLLPVCGFSADLICQDGVVVRSFFRTTSWKYYVANGLEAEYLDQIVDGEKLLF